MVEGNYPYISGKCGIPLENIGVPFRGNICGGSGRRIFCSIDSDNIVILDATEQKFRLSASVNTESVTVAVRSRDWKNGERHPDLFGKKFVAWALRYFESQGHFIGKFKSEWFQGDDIYSNINYVSYREGIESGLDPIQAAKNTWTGKTVVELGFTEVADLREYSGGRVTLNFQRPS